MQHHNNDIRSSNIGTHPPIPALDSRDSLLSLKKKYVTRYNREYGFGVGPVLLKGWVATDMRVVQVLVVVVVRQLA